MDIIVVLAFIIQSGPTAKRALRGTDIKHCRTFILRAVIKDFMQENLYNHFLIRHYNQTGDLLIGNRIS